MHKKPCKQKQPKPKTITKKEHEEIRETYRNNRHIKLILLAATPTIYELLSCGQVLALE